MIALVLCVREVYRREVNTRTSEREMKRKHEREMKRKHVCEREQEKQQEELDTIKKLLMFCENLLKVKRATQTS